MNFMTGPRKNTLPSLAAKTNKEKPIFQNTTKNEQLFKLTQELALLKNNLHSEENRQKLKDIVNQACDLPKKSTFGSTEKYQTKLFQTVHLIIDNAFQNRANKEEIKALLRDVLFENTHLKNIPEFHPGIQVLRQKLDPAVLQKIEAVGAGISFDLFNKQTLHITSTATKTPPAMMDQDTFNAAIPLLQTDIKEETFIRGTNKGKGIQIVTLNDGRKLGLKESCKEEVFTGLFMREMGINSPPIAITETETSDSDSLPGSDSVPVVMSFINATPGKLGRPGVNKDNTAALKELGKIAGIDLFVDNCDRFPLPTHDFKIHNEANLMYTHDTGMPIAIDQCSGLIDPPDIDESEQDRLEETQKYGEKVKTVIANSDAFIESIAYYFVRDYRNASDEEKNRIKKTIVTGLHEGLRTAANCSRDTLDRIASESGIDITIMSRLELMQNIVRASLA